MGHFAREPDFARQPLGVDWRAARRAQKLQRDRLLQTQIVGAVDGAHAAAAERRDDCVTRREALARRERRRVGWPQLPRGARRDGGRRRRIER